MKRTLKILAIVTALCAALAISAFASYFDHCADALNELGLFRGTQNGYELDREPTRAEAATMLVRLLGAEEEALALTYTAPYTDVADWAKPYVQYLQDKGLTKGTSATTFGYSEKCTAQQYATFLLRALGYSDSEGGDFTYTEAMDFAREKGVVDEVNCNGDVFLRDNVAAMSYTALATAPKSGEADLLTKLVASGAVADAKGYDEFFASYRAYCTNGNGFENAGSFGMNMTVDADISAYGETIAKVNQSFEMVAEMNEDDADKSKMSYIGKIKTVDSNGTRIEDISYYYTDGYVYTAIADGKFKSAMSFGDAVEEMGTATMRNDADPISRFESFTAETAADGTVKYVGEYASSLLGVVEGIEFKEMTVFISVKDDALVSMGIVSSLTQLQGGVPVDLAMTVEATNIRYGDGITVTFPTDLNTYKEE